MVWKGLMSLPASPARRFKKRRSQRKKRKKKKEKRKNSKIVPRGPGRPRGESSIIGTPKSKRITLGDPGIPREYPVSKEYPRDDAFENSW